MAEAVQPIPIHGLGDQLRNMAQDPASGFFFDGRAVRLAPKAVNEELPVFAEVEKQCATRGVAQVIHFPRHLRREE